MYPKILFHYSNLNTNSPVLSNCIKLGEWQLQNLRFHRRTSQVDTTLKLGINICSS
jgi:hypothetical protein